jgi:hypothetical protein
MLGEHAAALAVPDPFDRFRKRRGQLAGAFTIALQQMERNALRRLLSYAGHAAQAVDQANE